MNWLGQTEAMIKGFLDGNSFRKWQTADRMLALTSSRFVFRFLQRGHPGPLHWHVMHCFQEPTATFIMMRDGAAPKMRPNEKRPLLSHRFVRSGVLARLKMSVSFQKDRDGSFGLKIFRLISKTDRANERRDHEKKTNRRR